LEDLRIGRAGQVAPEEFECVQEQFLSGDCHDNGNHQHEQRSNLSYIESVCHLERNFLISDARMNILFVTDPLKALLVNNPNAYFVEMGE
jgi:hypothetical protein